MRQSLHSDRWIRLLLPAILLFVFSSSLALAREPASPPGQPGDPQGPVGMDDLDVQLAQGQISDPLAGHTQFPWDKIALIWERPIDSLLASETYDVDASLGPPIAKYKGPPVPPVVQGAGSMDMAAGYLGGKAGWIQTVAAWEFPEGKISLYLQGYTADLKPDFLAERMLIDIGEQVAGEYSPNKGEYNYGALIRLASGDFDADGYDEFVLAWEGPNRSLNLKVYDTNGGLTPEAKGRIAGEALGYSKFLDVATGDFDGDGDAEIAVLWEGNGLSIKVYDVDRDGTLTPEARLTNQQGDLDPEFLGQLALATGDFNGDRVDEIAVGFNDRMENQSLLYLYQVSNNLHDLTRKGTASQPSGQDSDAPEHRVVGVGAGDFDADGIDEIVFVYGVPHDLQSNCYVQVYAADVDLNLTPGARTHSNWLTAYGELSLAVGDMNQDTVDEIVAAKVTVTGGGMHHINEFALGIFSVDPDLNAVRQKGLMVSEGAVSIRGDKVRHMALAVGGFDGKNVRVGPPTYSRLVDTKQVIAVINAPPKHKDEVDGEVFDVNVTDRCSLPPCTYAKYETEQKTSTTMGLATNRDWSVSTDAMGKYKFIAPSLAATYGQDFEKTTTSFKTMEFGKDVEANHDDAIVRLEQGLDVWEYPVYAADSDQIQGYILVTWPEKVDPTCSRHCEAAITAVIDGKDPLSHYQPNHEYGNVLSYSNQPPTDIDTMIKGDTMRYLGPNPYQMWVKWSDVEESETKKASKLDLLASLKLSDEKDLNVLDAKGTYGQGDVSVNKASFETSTSLHLYFNDIEQRFSYGVRPVLYWAKPDGRLVLDYVVSPGTAPPELPPTWWQATYDKPDPAFNLPWKEDPPTEAYRLLTKEITFEPPSPKAGETVTVTAKVRNYSLVGVNNVPLRFYNGDPDHGGKAIGDATVATLNPMSAKSKQVQFDTTGYSGQVVEIYAVIDPRGRLQEMHTDNNKAYARLPVKPAADAVPPATLSLTLDDIAFEPETPAAGEQVQITAMVHASGDTFTHVAVEFWDGEPANGGRIIGGQLIPMILSGQSAPTAIQWDTAGLRGNHDIWVAVHYQADEDISTDNRAHKVLNLEPHRLYLPAAWKN